MAALGVELIGHAVMRLSVSGPTSLTGRGYASMQQRPTNVDFSLRLLASDWALPLRSILKWISCAPAVACDAVSGGILSATEMVLASRPAGKIRANSATSSNFY